MLKQSDLEVRADAGKIYFDLQPAHREILTAPLDDMWATFAAGASHHALFVRGEVAGCCAVNDERELLFFYLHAAFEDVAEAIFDALVKRLGIVAACPSTVDPAFLSLSLCAGHGAEPKALQFQHVVEPSATALSGLRFAQAVDHSAAIAFVESAVDLPRSFLEPYLSERIEKRQLLLHEVGNEIVATGECRNDERQSGYAHLGLIVGRRQRSKGLGSRLMHALVLECRRRRLKPLCSTEPENLAARYVIQKAGFRARHRVFRVAFGRGD